MTKSGKIERLSDRSLELPLFRGYTYTAAVLLAVAGMAMLFAAEQRLRVLEDPDALLGLNNRMVLAFAGLLNLAISGYVITVRTLATQAIALLWLGLNCLIYRLGLAWIDVNGPPLVLEALGLKVGVRLTSLDICWKWFIGYLVLGSILVLFVEWQRLRRMKAEEFMRQYREHRVHDVSSSAHRDKEPAKQS